MAFCDVTACSLSQLDPKTRWQGAKTTFTERELFGSSLNRPGLPSKYPQSNLNAGSTGGKQNQPKKRMDVLGLFALSLRGLSASFRGPHCLQNLRIMICHIQIPIILRKSQRRIIRMLIKPRVGKTEISILLRTSQH